MHKIGIQLNSSIPFPEISVILIIHADLDAAFVLIFRHKICLLISILYLLNLIVHQSLPLFHLEDCRHLLYLIYVVK